MRRVIACCALAAAALGAAGPASAQVTVIGGGLAKACADAAEAGESSQAAEQACTTSLETELLAPLDRAGTFVNRGVIKMRNRKYDAAISDFDTAIRYQSNLAEAYVNRGAALIGAHRFGESLSDIENALQLGVKEPEKAYYNRAVAHEWMDQYKEAYLDYRKALELAPDWQLVKDQLARFTVGHAEFADPGSAAPTHP